MSIVIVFSPRNSTKYSDLEPKCLALNNKIEAYIGTFILNCNNIQALKLLIKKSY